MSKKIENKRFQLWVWYNTQSSDNPQNGWILAFQTDSPSELFEAKLKLDKNDEFLLTEKVELKVTLS